MSWFYLIVAGLFEIAWPIGLKMTNQAETRIIGFIIALIFMVGSGTMLWLAQKNIPMGTAYAVWTGIGAAGAFIVGIIYYHEPLTFLRTLGAIMIIGGVVILKLASN